MKEYIILVLKGIALGTANVIPGVSGGTIALITGIFERLINAIKSFNLKALKLIFTGKIRGFIEYTDLKFLIAVFLGIAIAIITIARLFGYLFENYPVYIWAYFFGLILASVYFVGKRVEKWTLTVIFSIVIGTALALVISYLNPANENSSIIYLMVCGVVAVCSMILPGLSGSFVLILMGNYQLVMIDAVNEARLDILIPVIAGAAIGLIAFSHFLSWIFKKFRNQTIALLTGFIFGSLSILWPWKKEIFLMDETGEMIIRKGVPEIAGYQRIIPETFNTEVIFAILLMILGIATIWILEKGTQGKPVASSQ